MILLSYLVSRFVIKLPNEDAVPLSIVSGILMYATIIMVVAMVYFVK